MIKFVIGLSFVVLIGLASFFIFRGEKQSDNIAGETTNNPIVLEEFRQKDIYNSFSGDWMNFGVNSGSKATILRAVGGKITLGWSNLPKGTTYINIFRKSLNGDSWIKWKTIFLDEGGESSLQVDGSYKYAIQAVSEEGDILWSSQANAVVVSSNPANSSEESTPIQTNPVTEQSIVNPISPPNTITPPSTSSTPEGNIYNTQGQVVGYAPVQTANFWVHYVNKEIELGWQNLPYNTNRLVIDRSSNSADWLKLFEQQNPRINMDFIRLIDETFTQPFYYRFNAYNNDELVGVYGPLYLAPYGN